jgi:hypothetical protein
MALLVVLAVGAAACSDDGEQVRGQVTEIGDADGGSGSASGSASASAPASGSGSASAPGAAPEEVGVASDGGYDYASNVDAHRRVVIDLCGLGALLDAGDFDGAEALYRDGGSSVNSDGSVRTIAGFATRTDRLHGLDDYYGTPTPLDDFVSEALTGTGRFDAASVAVRAQAVEKGMRNQVMVAWLRHELATALEKAAEGDLDPASGAPHNWDEGWAFYHGAEPSCAPWATGNSRAANFGTLAVDGETAQANEAIRAAMIAGRDALLAGDVAAAGAAVAEVERGLVIIYSQAAVRYATLIEGDLAADDLASAEEHQVEGLAFYLVVESLVADAGADVATLRAVFDLDAGPGANGFGGTVRAAFAPAWEALGIDAADIGELG